ncbi:hypothetical protein PMAYCL1PPCAC_10431, partial [Pristionchus mayeri]
TSSILPAWLAFPSRPSFVHKRPHIGTTLCASANYDESPGTSTCALQILLQSSERTGRVIVIVKERPSTLRITSVRMDQSAILVSSSESAAIRKSRINTTTRGRRGAPRERRMFEPAVTDSINPSSERNVRTTSALLNRPAKKESTWRGVASKDVSATFPNSILIIAPPFFMFSIARGSYASISLNKTCPITLFKHYYYTIHCFFYPSFCANST